MTEIGTFHGILLGVCRLKHIPDFCANACPTKATPSKASCVTLRALQLPIDRDTARQDVDRSNAHAGMPKGLQSRAMTGVTRSPETDIQTGRKAKACNTRRRQPKGYNGSAVTELRITMNGRATASTADRMDSPVGLVKVFSTRITGCVRRTG